MTQSKFVKVISIIALIVGVLDIITYFATYVSDSTIASTGINTRAYDFSMWMSLAFAISEVTAGISGIVYWKRTDKISNCIWEGWDMVVFALLSTIAGVYALSAVSGLLAATYWLLIISTVIDLVIPIIFLVAVYNFRKKAV